jgi:hypothetical protein
MMAMVRMHALSKVSSLVPRKLQRLTRKLIPRWKKPKLLRRLIGLRCEGVERGVVECNFCKKYSVPFEAWYIS